jgi:tRNA(Ile)-lysidine synthase
MGDAGQGAVVAVATSGGRDSLALLHATLRSARTLGLRVVALHVHHGLMAEADRWAADLQACCASWAQEGWPVRFASARLAGAPSAGESVEAWARRERYAALARMARELGATIVLLGHHRRDQAETVVLQALRGAGAAGLAAMPRVVERGGIVWARPWIAQTHEAIDAYVAPLKLTIAVDPSNGDPRFARGRLRSSVMPALRTAFPDAETALASVARHANEARAVLEEVAIDDLRRVGAGDELPLAAWRTLSPARRANALRAWLALRLGHAAPDTLVQRLLDETGDDATRRWPADNAHGLRSWRGRLAVLALVEGRQAPVRGQAPGCVPYEPTQASDAHTDPPDEMSAGQPGCPTAEGLSLLRCHRYGIAGWCGRLEVFVTARHGIAPHRLALVFARPRAGGERFQLQPAGIARSLKKQYQEVGVAAEGREGPLLFDANGALLFAPGLGIDARAWVSSDAPQWGLRWHRGADSEG